jgi:hypothetical protein
LPLARPATNDTKNFLVDALDQRLFAGKDTVQMVVRYAELVDQFARLPAESVLGKKRMVSLH